MLYKKRIYIFALILAAFIAFASCDTNQKAQPVREEDGLKVVFINVQKADAALIIYDGHSYLIDTGTDQSLPSIIRTLKTYGIEKLDGVFLTHTDKDHIGGLSGIAELVGIDAIYMSEINYKSAKNGQDVESVFKKHAIDFSFFNAGAEKTIPGAKGDAVISAVAPRTQLDDENDNSMVMYLDFDGYTFLFAGDMRYEQEQTLFGTGALRDCDVLKVGYHGNDGATSVDFLQKVTPEIAIITSERDLLSVGLATDAVKNLKEIGADIYITGGEQMGIEFEITQGQIVTGKAEYKEFEKNLDIEIQHIDNIAEYVTIINKGKKSADLTGWWLVSDKGNEVYYFPEGTEIEPGGQLTLASDGYDGEYDLYWQDGNIWKNKKDDKGILYDSNGNYVDSFETPVQG